MNEVGIFQKPNSCLCSHLDAKEEFGGRKNPMGDSLLVDRGIRHFLDL